jgi:hypothetical protein
MSCLQVRVLKSRDEESQNVLNRTKEDLLKSAQRVSQMESEMAYMRRQHDDEYDRLDREMRRYRAEMSDVAIANRRLEGQASAGYSHSPRPARGLAADGGYGEGGSRGMQTPPVTPPRQPRQPRSYDRGAYSGGDRDAYPKQTAHAGEPYSDSDGLDRRRCVALFYILLFAVL